MVPCRNQLQRVAEWIGKVDRRVPRRTETTRTIDGNVCGPQSNRKRIELVYVDGHRRVRVGRGDRLVPTALEEEVQLGAILDLHREMQRAVVRVCLGGPIGAEPQKRLAVELAHEPGAQHADVEPLSDVQVVYRESDVMKAFDWGSLDGVVHDVVVGLPSVVRK